MSEAPVLTEGTEVRFTSARLGLVEEPGSNRFVEATVGKGDTGTYHSAGAVSDWHHIKVNVDGTDLYCPVHESMFEVVS